MANSHVLPWLRSAECASEEGLGGRQVAIDVAAVEPWRRQDRLRFVAEHQSGPTFKVFGEQQWHHPFRVGLGDCMNRPTAVSTSLCVRLPSPKKLLRMPVLTR